MKYKNLFVGQRVQVKQIFWTGFYRNLQGCVGTVSKINPEYTYLNVEVVFDGGGTDWGNHAGLRKVKGNQGEPTL